MIRRIATANRMRFMRIFTLEWIGRDRMISMPMSSMMMIAMILKGVLLCSGWVFKQKNSGFLTDDSSIWIFAKAGFSDTMTAWKMRIDRRSR